MGGKLGRHPAAESGMIDEGSILVYLEIGPHIATIYIGILGRGNKGVKSEGVEYSHHLLVTALHFYFR